MSFNSISVANFSDSNDEQYEAELARRHADVEILLRQQEEKEQLECQARKEAKLAERKRLEEEEETWWREEERQRDLTHYFKADCVAAVQQQHRKNWLKTFLPLSNPPSDEEMNFIDLCHMTENTQLII